MKRILLINALLLVGLASTAFGQITVQNTQSPNSLVQNVLLGTGVVATNVTYNGSAVNANSVQSNVSYFNAAGTTFPIASGVLLTTGVGTSAIGPNNSGSATISGTPLVSTDADLIAIANGSVTNGAVLEFDFIPSGDTVSFRYVFGSDEYPEFSPSTFNDAFGFFLSGPGFAGPYTNGAVNVALIPGTTTPVTINNVGDQSNTMYYVDNLGGAAYGNAIQYDGTTVVLTAVAQVQCGQTYHIKLAICNVGDQSYDSGVFLEADSFTSEAVEISVATITGDTSVVEGCTSADFLFVRSENMTADTLSVTYTIDGTAIQGTDYNNLPNPVVFLPGVDTMIITLVPIADGISEAPEYVTITATTITECNDTIVSVGTLWILDEPFLTVNAADPTVLCANDSVPSMATPDGGLPPYTYVWSQGGQTGQTAYLPISAPGSVDYYVTMTDACGFVMEDTATVTLDPLLIDSLHQTPSPLCVNQGTVAGFFSGNIGATTLHWTGPGNPGTFNSSTANMNSLPPGEYFFTVTSQGCTVIDSIDVGIAPNPTANIVVNVTEPTTSCPNDSLVSTATASGGFSPYTYSWSYGGQTGPTAYLPISVPGTMDYTVTATDACGNQHIETVTLTYIPTLQIDSMHMTPSAICVPTGSVTGFFSGNTGAVTLHWTGPGNPGTFNSATASLNSIPAGEYFFTVSNAGCVVTDSIIVTNLPAPVIAITESDITIGCPTDSAMVTALANNGTAPYTYTWSYLGQTGPTAYVPNQVNGTSINYFVTATDACGFTATDTVTVTLNQTLAIDTMYSYPASACNADGAVSGVAVGITGTPLYHWEGPDTTGAYQINASVLQNIPSGWYYFTVTDAVCAVSDSVFVDQTGAPVAAFTASALTGCDPLDVIFTNTSQNATSFTWDFGNGQTTITNDLGMTSTTYSMFGGTVQMIAFLGNCSDTAYATITVSTCGCTDPIGLNYNPLATVEDGSCVYPIPTCEVPNVFTPDNTGVNDFYELITTFALNIDMTITNRWGNVLFQQSGLSPKWDGKAQSGSLAEDGVYFVTYKIQGLTQSIEGHGFFHLVR